MNAATARVLIVDDEINLAEGIRENLEFEGYSTDVAHDGEEGLEKLRTESFDLVLLDVMMPKLDGLQVCAKLREAGNQTPVLFLTVRNDVDDRVRGFDITVVTTAKTDDEGRALLRALGFPFRSTDAAQ